MKKIYKQLAIYASMAVVLSSCDPREKSDFYVDKPESIAMQEQIDSYDVLKSYVNKTTNPGFLLGASLPIDEYLNTQVKYRVVTRNFDQIEVTGFNHGTAVRADGTLDLSKVVGLMETAKAANTTVLAGPLVSSSNQNSTYLNEKIAPLIIQGAAAKVVIANFDNDNLGTTYPMSPAGASNSATVVVNNVTKTGRVLNVKSVQSFPVFNVTLPAGRTLGDYVSVTWEIWVQGCCGRFGGGMRMGINGGPLVGYPSPANSGIGDGVWGKMTLPLATMNLTAQQKQLNTFTLTIGSATGGGNYFVDNVSLEDINIPKTPAQKTQLIENEMQRWISAVVDTGKTYIKAWDVVSEPMSNTQPAELKTGIGQTAAAGEFFWQDYLGKDYAVKAFQLARQHGNPDDKLFITETGLVTNTAKTNGLISYIAYIEGKGAKVDGIGTELDLTVNSDKAQIDQMFQLLAASGKLIRVSGLKVDLGTTKQLATAEMYQKQSDMYKYVIDKYFELVPSAQRYGITIHGLVDPDGTSADPSGLWTDKYVRKPAYVGLVEGLQ